MKYINWWMVLAAIGLTVMVVHWPFDARLLFLAVLLFLVAMLLGVAMRIRDTHWDQIIWALLGLVFLALCLLTAAKAFLAGGRNGGSAIGIVVFGLVFFVAVLISICNVYDRRQHYKVHAY